MTAIVGVSALDLGIEWITWRRRVEAGVRNSPDSSETVSDFASHLMHQNPSRHLGALEQACRTFLRRYKSLDAWWRALATEGNLVVRFHDQTPMVGVGSLSTYRHIMARIDTDALIALLAVDGTPKTKSQTSWPKLTHWGVLPEIFDRDFRVFLDKGLFDTHVHFEGSDPIPVLWTRLQSRDIRLEALQRYDEDLVRNIKNRERQDERLREREAIRQAIEFRRIAVGQLSIPTVRRLATPTEQLGQERCFLRAAWAAYAQPPTNDFCEHFDHYLVAKSLFLREHQQFPGSGTGLQRFRDFAARPTPLNERDPRLATDRRKLERTKRLAAHVFDSKAVSKAELRISPRASRREWNKTFRIWETASLQTTYPRDTGFTVHFSRSLRPGHSLKSYRSQHQTLERESAVLHEFRHACPRRAKYIVGLDVASGERDTPPDIMIPYLRLLRGNTSALGNPRLEPLPTWNRLRARNLHGHSFDLPRLGQTYHAGEDFYHLSTGLRHIHTLLIHLLEPGDRIGHGLVLGLCPEKWIATNKPHLQMPRGVVLDDMVWLHAGIPTFAPGRADFAQDLEKEISRLSADVYGDSIPPQVLAALAIERTNPPCAASASCSNLAQRLHQRECNEPDLYIRRHELCSDQAVALLNREPQVIREAQRALCRLVASEGVTIETNPTSNLATGMIHHLSEHPLHRILADTAQQARLSINTDDPGVFATRLDWEYGLVLETLIHDSKLARQDALSLLDRLRATAIESIFRSSQT